MKTTAKIIFNKIAEIGGSEFNTTVTLETGVNVKGEFYRYIHQDGGNLVIDDIRNDFEEGKILAADAIRIIKSQGFEIISEVID